ncbi:hypothetical protein KUTeg_019902 [Tegillarca granosa]|uniref:protein-tyrosine-phosphatase n=1 Tax=Tegillarca granosa TaxID=220873 RepID=A0ABQ9EI09_TEGGR|nr:hypothetical protein KUTeg_019902 [Tegillarca granosa]
MIHFKTNTMASEIEKEFLQYDKHNAWAMVFQEIKNESAMKAMEDEYSTQHAKRPQNRNKNRYRDVNDHSRIYLRKDENDYINASLVDVADADRQYILTQPAMGKVFKNESEQNYFIVRTLEIEEKETGNVREVLHFQYITWPDFGVPSSPLAFLNFLMAVRESGGLDNDVGPAVIHCSAGIGRSGTFCLVDSCLVIAEREKNMDSFDVRSMLLSMRNYRMGLIQTPDQLRFSYLAIIEGGKRLLSDEDSTLSVLSSYLEEESNHADDTPPPPPVRTVSLSPNNKPPPLPPREGLPRKLEEIDGLNANTKLQNDLNNATDEVIPEKTDNENSYEVRKRIRDQRKKDTQEQINRMRQKQKDSDLWKKRKSYFKPIALGISIIIGGLIIYHFYWNR